MPSNVETFIAKDRISNISNKEKEEMLTISSIAVDDIIMLYQLIAIMIQESHNQPCKEVLSLPTQEAQTLNNLSVDKQINKDTMLGVMQIINILSDYNKNYDDEIKTQDISNHFCSNDAEELSPLGENYTLVSVY